jgi:predicted transcriptional regulator
MGKRELEIMNVVWDRGEATVQDVCDRLARPAAYSTVLTMMRTLETKGVLQHRVEGRSFVYEPLISRALVRTSMIGDLRDLLFGGSTALLINSMLSGNAMRPDEIEELGRLVEQIRRPPTSTPEVK